MTLAELGSRMDSAEFTEWLAFEQEYGLPDGYLVAGLTCSTIARNFSGAKVGPEDYIPYYKSASPAQSNDELANKLLAFAAAHNKGLKK